MAEAGYLTGQMIRDALDRSEKAAVDRILRENEIAQRWHDRFPPEFLDTLEADERQSLAAVGTALIYDVAFHPDDAANINATLADYDRRRSIWENARV